MKLSHFLIFSVLFVPCMGYAQEAPQPKPSSEPRAVSETAENAPKREADQAGPATGTENGGNAANNAQPAPPRRRITRTIENREFSNKDKIQLLLSAHCDFPTKEDLISTVNTDMLASDRASDSQNAESAANVQESAVQKVAKAAGAAVGKNAVSQSDIENYLQDTLFAILSDESQLFSVRRRALEALAYFDTPKNVRMLEYIVSHPDQIKRPLMLVQAIRSYPQVAPQNAPAALAPYLDSPNDMIRFVTISTLKNTPGKEALRVLQERRNVEKNAFFKTRLDEAIENHCKKDVYCGTGGGF